MLNKFNKIIHIKYSKFLRFIFFLRYLFAIFLTSIALFLIIPNFFDYEKKIQIIKDHLAKNYDLEINNYEKIGFKSLPSPRLELKNVKLNLKSSPIEIDTKNLQIYLNILSIYNYDNFQPNKIVLQNSNIVLEANILKFLIKNLFDQRNKLFLKNLNLKVQNKNSSIINFENIEFKNFGYRKGLIKGKVFKKKFIIKIGNNFENINFKIPNSGINADVIFDPVKKNLTSGIFKSKILSMNLKAHFDFNDRILNIKNLYFRNKNLSFKNNSSIAFKPFLDIESNFDVEEFNFKILQNAKLENLVVYKNLIKKINSKNQIYFKSKKFARNKIEEAKIKIDLAYGRLDFEKKFLVLNANFLCKGYINIFEEFPLIFFDCNLTSNNRKKFLQQFSIKEKNKNQTLDLKVQGNVSLINEKINLKNILVDENYKASKEDLIYFKQTFEEIVLKEGLFEIYDFKKIKKFILEIS